MSAMNPDNESCSCSRQMPASLVRRQRLAIASLAAALVVSLACGQQERMRSQAWQATAERLMDQTKESSPEFTGTPSVLNSGSSGASLEIGNTSESGFYTATLIGKNGEKTPLDGMAVQFDLGNRRLLEVSLQRQRNDHLFVWAPAKRGDDIVNCLDLHPLCCNAMLLELEQHSLKSETSGNNPLAVQYEGMSH